MTYVYEYNVGNDNVKVEYCFSSVTDAIKVVDMWVNGKIHRTNWMSAEGNKMCGTRADAGLNDDGDSYVDNLLTTGFDTEVDLDRDVPPVVSALTGGE